MMVFIADLEGAQPRKKEADRHSCTYFLLGVENERNEDIPEEQWNRSKRPLDCARLGPAGHVVQIKTTQYTVAQEKFQPCGVRHEK